MKNGERRPAQGWQFAAFRKWHGRVHPRTAYRVKPHVWTPEGLRRVEGKSEAERVQWKNCEPTLTGIVFTDLHVYLMLALTELDAEGVGRMLYLAYLWRRDPDYAPHHAKHHHCVMLVRDGARSVIEFARRHQIRVVPCPFDGIVTGEEAASGKQALDDRLSNQHEQAVTDTASALDGSAEGSQRRCDPSASE